ncbi:MAG: hypothetical protein AAF225_02145 [Pseudomonadota bacterium]
MKIVDPQDTRSGVAAKGAIVLRNVVLALLLLLGITTGAVAAFSAVTHGSVQSGTTTTDRHHRTSAAIYGTLGSGPAREQHYPTEGVDAFRQRSENQVKDHYDQLEEGLYERILEAGLEGKGGPFAGDDPVWNDTGDAENDAARMIPVSFGGSMEGSFSGLTTTSLEELPLDPLFDPAQIAGVVPLGQLPQIVFPSLSGSGAPLPPSMLMGDDMLGEVPVPGAALLFPAGLALLFNARKRLQR